MPFARPTLNEIIDRVIADIGSRVIGVDSAVLRRSLLGILGRAESGAAHQLYGYIDWVARQAIPDTAEKDYLERWARIWGITRKQAVFASGVITFTGSNGAAIPVGTIVQRQDGQQYATRSAATISAGTANVPVQATTAGAQGNTPAAARMVLLQPVLGVQSSATVGAGGLTGAEDVENDERLLARLLQRIQEPPQGGSVADYVLWGLEVAGVTRVWVTPLAMGGGTVGVQFITEDAVGGIIPDPAKVAEVQAYIDIKRPVTAEVFVTAPIASPLNMTIKLEPNTAAVRDAVLAELGDLISREAAPGQPILISRLREAVSTAAGESDNEIVTPTANVTPAAGHIVVLGTVTFQSF